MAMCDPSPRSPVRQDRVALGIVDLRRMRQSSGSPILERVLAALPEPLSRWIADDLGVDQQGIYELVINAHLYQEVEYLLGGGNS